MEYFKEGIVSITSELTLKDFHWKLQTGCYDFEKSEATIEVIMWENAYPHSRFFTFPCTIKVTPQDCLDAILSMPQFAKSIPQ